MLISEFEFMFYLSHPVRLRIKKYAKYLMLLTDDALQLRFIQGWAFESYIGALTEHERERSLRRYLRCW